MRTTGGGFPFPMAIVTIDPTDMRVHVEGFGDMTEDVARELHALRRAQTERDVREAAGRQAMLARELPEARRLGGEVRVVGQVDEAVYQHWIDREGPQFWADKSNRNFMLKRHPELRVRSVSDKPSVFVSGYTVNDRRSAAHLRPACA